MNTGHALVAAAIPAAVVVLVATLATLGWRSGNLAARATAIRVARSASWLVLALVAAATMLLTILLAIGDFSVAYVWRHSATFEPLLWRVSALLAGQEGSFLVWTLAAAAVGTWTAHRWARSDVGDPLGTWIVHLVTCCITLALLALTLASAPFESFAAAFPSLDVTSSPVEGRGLNPVLANPWMPPHTLLTFIGYALIGLGFAVAVAELVRAGQGRHTEARQWRRHTLAVGRLAWLALSASLLTGLLWAYEEMSFGWFWSWDPVEAATLAVWLVLTAALHARAETGGGRRQLVVAPVLTGATFVGVLFASFVTRSGLHPSVHAFASGSLGRYLGVLLAGVVACLGALAAVAWRSVPATSPRRPWMSWAVWILVGAAGMIVWGLSYPMVSVGLLGRTVELETGYFTLLGYVVALVLLLMTGFGLQRARGRTRDARLALGVFTALTVLAAFVEPVKGLALISAERRATVGMVEATLGRASLLTIVPPAAYALLAICQRWWAGLPNASRRARLVHTGSAGVHLGAVSAIAGVILATTLSSTVTVHVDPSTQVGSAEGVTVLITGLQRSTSADRTGTVVEERETVTIEVRTGRGVLADGEASLSTYPERNMGRHPDVLIERAFVGDVQVIYHGLGELGPAGIPVTVRMIPFVNLVWGGMALLLVGMAIMFAARGRDRQADVDAVVEFQETEGAAR